MRGDVRKWFHCAGIGRAADRVEALLRPSIRIRTRERAEDAIEVGASKIGGLPDLPPGWERPRYLPGWR